MDAIQFEDVISTWQGKVGKPGKTTVRGESPAMVEGAKIDDIRVRKIVAYVNKRLDKSTIFAEDAETATVEVARDGSTTHFYRITVRKPAAAADEPTTEA